MSDEENKRRGGVPRSSLMIGATVFTVVLGLQVTGSYSGKSTTGRAVGMGNQAGGCNADMVVAQPELPEGVKVVYNDIPETLARKEAPDELPDFGIDGDYVIKINPRAGVKGKLADVTDGFTGVAAVDIALQDLGAQGFRNVYLDQEAKMVGGGLVGAERVFEFASDEVPDAIIELLEDLDEVEWVEPVQQMNKFSTPKN